MTSKQIVDEIDAGAYTRTIPHGSGAGKEETSADDIQVFVKTVSGKTITVNMSASDNVRKMKKLIEIRTEVPSEDQHLSFSGKVLEDESAIGEYGIVGEYTIHMAAKLRGGGMDDAEIRSAFGKLETMLKDMEAKLETEKAKNEDLRKTVDIGKKSNRKRLFIDKRNTEGPNERDTAQEVCQHPDQRQLQSVGQGNERLHFLA